MVCLDTSFVIDLISSKGKAVDNIVTQIDNGGDSVFIPSVVLMELYNSAYSSNNSSLEMEKIEKFVSSFNIIDFSKDEANIAGKIEFELRKKGEMIQIEDVMIASCAIKNDQVLVTRNKKDFENIKSLKIRSY